jgi:hypothetical protein
MNYFHKKFKNKNKKSHVINWRISNFKENYRDLPATPIPPPKALTR